MMKNLTKAAIAGLAMLGFATIGAVGSASAAVCSGSISADASFSCTFSDSNVTELDNQSTFTITWDAALLQLTVSVSGAPAGATLLGYDSFGFNGTELNYTTLPLAWSLNGGTCGAQGSQDGFGKFTDCAGNSSAGQELLTNTFQLVDSNLADATLGLFDINAVGTTFAAHVKYTTNPTSSCSAFFGDNNIATHPLGSDECTGVRHEGPEPGSLLLLGVGVLALGLARRKMGTRL